jgi:hypothetical protein
VLFRSIKNAKVASVTAKCSDSCHVVLMDDKGGVIAEHAGYVPDFMPGEHFGDYVEIDIDLETGRILNWKKPTAAQLAKPRRNAEWELPGCDG